MTQTSVTPEPLPLTDTLLFVALCEISSTQTGKVMQLFCFFFVFVCFCVCGRGSRALSVWKAWWNFWLYKKEAQWKNQNPAFCCLANRDRQSWLQKNGGVFIMKEALNSKHYKPVGFFCCSKLLIKNYSATNVHFVWFGLIFSLKKSLKFSKQL